jgi:hypothetical protein
MTQSLVLPSVAGLTQLFTVPVFYRKNENSDGGSC